MSRLPKTIASFNVIHTHIPVASTEIGKRIRKLAWTHRRPGCLSKAEEAASGRRRAPDQSRVRAPGTQTGWRPLNTHATVQRSGKPRSEPARAGLHQRESFHTETDHKRLHQTAKKMQIKTTGRHPLAPGNDRPKTRNNDAGEDAENGEPQAPHWEWALVRPRWKPVRRFLKTFKLEIP